jgi:hypothetical protein
MSGSIGKIARLPRKIRDDLNQRLDDGQPDGPLLDWLNALPEVHALLASDFDGIPISKQNLSNWRQGGHQQWLLQQEGRQMVRDLVENGKELADDAGGAELAGQLTLVMVAQLAASAQAELAKLEDPGKRCARLQEILGTLARVRRQDHSAARVAIEQERRARERKEENREDQLREESAREFESIRPYFQRVYMTNSYARPDLAAQGMANLEAESLLRGVTKSADTPTTSSQSSSNPLIQQSRPDSALRTPNSALQGVKQSCPDSEPPTPNLAPPMVSQCSPNSELRTPNSALQGSAAPELAAGGSAAANYHPQPSNLNSASQAQSS